MSAGRVIVIGGGIAGLACAHRLMSLGVDVVLLEASGRVGGKIETIREDGVEFEAGPNTVVVNKQGTLDLIAETGLNAELIEASPGAKARFIAMGDRLEPVPMNPIAALTSPLLGPGALFRAAGDLWRTRRSGVPADETVARFIERRFGRRILERLVEPALAGVYAGDVDALEARSVLGRLVEAEEARGSVIRGMIAAGRAAKREGRKRLPMRMVTFRGGLARLPQRLFDLLGDRVRTGTPVERLERAGDGCAVIVAGERLVADRVVVATEAGSAAELIRDLPGAEEAAAGLSRVPTAAICVVGLVYERAAHPSWPEGFGYLSGPGSPKRTLGCLFRSSLFPGCTPAGRVLLTAFVGGARDASWRDLSDERIAERVHADLAQLMGVEGEPVRRLVRRWDSAIAQYNRGHAVIRRGVESWSEGAPVSVVGGALTGISVNDCIAAGRERADMIARHPRLAGGPA